MLALVLVALCAFETSAAPVRGSKTGRKLLKPKTPPSSREITEEKGIFGTIKFASVPIVASDDGVKVPNLPALATGLSIKGNFCNSVGPGLLDGRFTAKLPFINGPFDVGMILHNGLYGRVGRGFYPMSYMREGMNSNPCRASLFLPVMSISDSLPPAAKVEAGYKIGSLHLATSFVPSTDISCPFITVFAPYSLQGVLTGAAKVSGGEGELKYSLFSGVSAGTVKVAKDEGAFNEILLASLLGWKKWEVIFSAVFGRTAPTKKFREFCLTYRSLCLTRHLNKVSLSLYGGTGNGQILETRLKYQPFSSLELMLAGGTAQNRGRSDRYLSLSVSTSLSFKSYFK